MSLLNGALTLLVLLAAAGLVTMVWIAQRNTAMTTNLRVSGCSTRRSVRGVEAAADLTMLSKGRTSEGTSSLQLACDAWRIGSIDEITAGHGPLFNYSADVVRLAKDMAARIDNTNMTNWRRAFSSISRRNAECAAGGRNSTICTSPVTLNIAAFGGSMVQGVGCDGGPWPAEKCAYPSRIRERLERLFVTNNNNNVNVAVSMMNLARSGWTSRLALFSFRSIIRALPFTPDIVLLDFSVNDFYEDGRLGRLHVEGGRRESAILSMGNVFEALLMLISFCLPNAAVLLIVSPFGADVDQTIAHEGLTRSYDSISAQRSLAAKHRGVAVVDMYTASIATAWQPWNANSSEFFLVRNLMQEFNWTFEHAFVKLRSIHPPWQVHDAMADVIVDVLARLYRRSCSDDDNQRSGDFFQLKDEYQPVFPKAKDYARCFQPTTLIDAYNPPAEWSINTSTPDGGWALVEDRRKKPGWISTRENSTISFTIRFDRKLMPRMTLTATYLKSYGAWASAVIYFVDVPKGGPKAPWGDKGGWKEQLNGQWGMRLSLPQVESFDSGYDHGFYEVNMTDEAATATLVVRHAGPDGAKFKLIAVSAC